MGSVRNVLKAYIRKSGLSIQYWVAPRETVLCDNDWLDISGYASGRRFKTENSEPLLKRVIENTSRPSDWVMDYFLGSGTTTAVAQKLQRKWIGVEMGPHFESVVVPRMKSVCAGDPTGISKDIGWNGGGCFKYQELEQFEDTLDNLFLSSDQIENSAIADLSSPNELSLRYNIQFENEMIKITFNFDSFRDPFNVSISISHGIEYVPQTIDLIETFNYLLGFRLERVISSESQDRFYLFLSGRRESNKVLIIWRSLIDLDLETDLKWISKTVDLTLFDQIFVNGKCNLNSYQCIEMEFQSLMMP